MESTSHSILTFFYLRINKSFVLIHCYFFLFLVIYCSLCVLVCLIYDLLFFLLSSLFLFSFLFSFFLLRSLLLLSSIFFSNVALFYCSFLFPLPPPISLLPFPSYLNIFHDRLLLHVPTVPDWVRNITVTYSFPDEPCVTRFCVEGESNRIESRTWVLTGYHPRPSCIVWSLVWSRSLCIWFGWEVMVN